MAKRIKVSVAVGVCVERDAISEATRGSIVALRSRLNADVKLFTHACEMPDVDAVLVGGVSEMLIHEHFATSDLIIYHFGVAYEMFGALALGNGRARQMVRYHNITPKDFLPTDQHALITRSLAQATLIERADSVLADSEFNRRDLVRLGVPQERVELSPLYVKFSTSSAKRVRRVHGGAPRWLYVGRFVQSKGILELVHAAGMLAREGLEFSLTLCGNLSFSDPEYLKIVHGKIASLGLARYITVAGSVDDTALGRLYAAADVFVMPSFHEGFCVPVLEALHAGCVVVSSDAGNLPDLTRGIAATYRAGDTVGLAAALRGVTIQLHLGFPDFLDLGGARVSRKDYEAAVSSLLSHHTFESFADRFVSSVERVMAWPGEPRAQRPWTF